jgi:hypothetical protein
MYAARLAGKSPPEMIELVAPSLKLKWVRCWASWSRESVIPARDGDLNTAAPRGW